MTSLDQYQLISMSAERRKEQRIDWETERERKSEKVTVRKASLIQFGRLACGGVSGMIGLLLLV